PSAPDERMPVSVPTLGRHLNGAGHFGPSLKASTFERQRAEHFPPRLDQVEGGGILRPEEELPPRRGKREQQDVRRAMRFKVIQDGIDPPHLSWNPGLHPLKKVHPVLRR